MPYTTRLTPETAEALCKAIANGWTVKEAACYTGRSIKAIHNATLRAGVCLTYGGRGPRPTAERLQMTKDFFAQNQNTQTTKTK